MMRRPNRLLLVDDDLDSRELYQLTLAMFGYEVVVAADGRSAIEAASHNAPDAIVTDYTLPAMDGLMLARHFRADPRTADAAILLLSGYRFDKRQTPGATLCDAMLVKPVAPDELAAAVRDAVVARTAARLQRTMDRVCREVASSDGGTHDQMMRTIARTLGPAHRQIAALLVNRDARYVAVNDAACELMERSRPSILAASVWDLTPDGKADTERAMWRTFVERGALAGPYALLASDGVEVPTWFAARANVAPDLHLSLLEATP